MRRVFLSATDRDEFLYHRLPDRCDKTKMSANHSYHPGKDNRMISVFAGVSEGRF
jgi:hypothetical protein